MGSGSVVLGRHAIVHWCDVLPQRPGLEQIRKERDDVGIPLGAGSGSERARCTDAPRRHVHRAPQRADAPFVVDSLIVDHDLT